MGCEAIKLELFDWLTNLEADETIENLKIVKDSRSVADDWWNDLPNSQKLGIERGLDDINNGRTTSHKDIKERYEL